MKIKLLTDNKFWCYLALSLVSLYALIWGIGYYRVYSIVENLKAENQIKGDRIEHCYKSLKEGDKVQKLDPILDIGQTVVDGKLSKYYFFYNLAIQETSSVTNRMPKSFKIEARNGIIYSLHAQRGAITHGDRFTSHWKFYPLVCFFGLETFETYERR